MGGKVHGGAGGKAHEMDPQSLLDRIMSDADKRRWLLADAGRPGGVFDPNAPPPPKENNDPFDPLNNNDPRPPRRNPGDDPTGGNNGDPPYSGNNPPNGGNVDPPNGGPPILVGDVPTGGRTDPTGGRDRPTIGTNDPPAGGTRVAGNDTYTGGNTINPPPPNDRYTGGINPPPPPAGNNDRYTGGTAVADSRPRDPVTGGGGSRVAGVRSSGLTAVAMRDPARAVASASRTSGLIPQDQMMNGAQTASYFAARGQGGLAAAFQPTGIG